MNKKIKQSGIVVCWIHIECSSVMEDLGIKINVRNIPFVNRKETPYSIRKFHTCENSTKSLGISIHTSPTVVVQLRFIGSSCSCGSSIILATKAVTIERPASLRANLEIRMGEQRLKQSSDRPIGILDWRRLLYHPPSKVAPEEEWKKGSRVDKKDLSSQPGWSSENAPAATPNNL